MTRLISSAVKESLQELHRLWQSERLDQYASEVPRALWEDELGRLRVWAANIGAHQTGQSSLDFRLRDSSHVRQTILRVLERLERTMRDLEEVLDDSAMDEDPISDFSDSEDDVPEKKEIQSIYSALRDSVNNLFQMSITIRHPAQSDRLRGTKRSDAVAFEPFDRDHVYNKFPTADGNILNRLALAISQRRAILRYRERHHAKLAQGISGALTGHTDTESVLMSDTVATEFVELPEAERPSYDTETVVSQTSYAQSMIQGKDRITIPPPPEGSENGIPFECPYCFDIVCIQNRPGWARHVFNDLMPYICIFPDCTTPHRLYQSRREWFHHFQSQHPQNSDSSSGTSCGLCNSPVTVGKPLERHLGRHLEELALFALPAVDADESGEDVNSIHASDDTEDRFNEDLLEHAMNEIRVPDISSPYTEDPLNIGPFASQLGSEARENRQTESEGDEPHGIRLEELESAVASIEQRASNENNKMDPTRRSATSSPSSLVAEPPEPLPGDTQMERPYSAISHMPQKTGAGDTNSQKSVVKEDRDGIQWIAFEYTRDRVKMEYTIRCDVESINVDLLDQQFKMANCVYPRAFIPKDQFDGNRYAYETECNVVGWGLAELNPVLRDKRGLLQRAVDSWRNSNQDIRLRSQRIPRQMIPQRRTDTGPVTASPPASSQGPLQSRSPSPEKERSLGFEDDQHSFQDDQSSEHTGNIRQAHGLDSDLDTDDEDLSMYREEPSAPVRHEHNRNDSRSDEEHTKDREFRKDDTDGQESERQQSGPHDHRRSRSDVPPKGILKAPRSRFPEVLSPIRRQESPIQKAQLNRIPPGTRWTKIDRRLVSPEALAAGKESFEVSGDHVIVFGVLTEEEIQAYSERTRELQGERITDPIEYDMVVGGLQKG